MTRKGNVRPSSKLVDPTCHLFGENEERGEGARNGAVYDPRRRPGEHREPISTTEAAAEEEDEGAASTLSIKVGGIPMGSIEPCPGGSSGAPVTPPSAPSPPNRSFPRDAESSDPPSPVARALAAALAVAAAASRAS